MKRIVTCGAAAGDGCLTGSTCANNGRVALSIVGELINHAYARARRAFEARDATGYQHLARLQAHLGVHAISVNLDRTRLLDVTMAEMRERLPEVISAIQDVTTLPLAFDNPALEYHQVALAHYDRGKGGRPILNSIAASRANLDQWLEQVAHHDTRVIVMASERGVPGGTARCHRAEDSHAVARHFVQRLILEAGRTPDQILIDPGLFPLGPGTSTIINTGLETIRLIREDPELDGVHCVVGLSNFTCMAPGAARDQMGNAYLTLAMEAGLDYVIANPERDPAPLCADHPAVSALRMALANGPGSASHF
jgi:cobalamin-dependent methionine synthase I